MPTTPPEPAPAWLAACVAEAQARGLATERLLPLLAFGHSAVLPPGSGAIADHEAYAKHLAAGAAGRIVSRLATEVDAAQAQLFARRFADVRQLIAARLGDTPLGRCLLVGLTHRLADILAADGACALRVRALVDFYYSQVAVELHRRSAGGRQPLADALDALGFQRVADGVAHAALHAHVAEGPVRVNLLRVTHGRLRAMACRGTRDLPALAAEHGAVAAVSGGFFLYSEPDIQPPDRRTDPVGLLVRDGRVISPPWFARSALVQRADGAVDIARIGVIGARLGWDAGDAVVGAVDTQGGAADGWSAWTRAATRRAPAHGRPAFAVAGRRVAAAGLGLLDVPLNGALLVGPPSARLPPPGTDLRVTLAPAWADVRDAMAGGPALLGDGALDLVVEGFSGSAPPVTFSQDETFDQNLLPRMVAGLTPEGTLFFCAVDGRRLDDAPGMTLRGAAAVLAALGCDRALNLDGGSSKRMVVAGRVVDAPSTEIVSGGDASTRVRPVHSAILIAARDA